MKKIYKINLLNNILISFTFTIAASAVMAQGVPELIYYKFNSSSAGTTPNDANSATRVGGTTGTLIGATIGGTGLFGSALQGTGTASTSNCVSSGWNLSLSGPWTISLWVSGVTNTVTSNYLFGATGGSTFRALTGTGVVAGGGNLEIRGTGMTDVFANAVFDATGSPVVIHYVYNPSTLDIKVYKNGVFTNSVTQTSTMTLTGTGAFTVGGYSTSIGLPSGGKMDEFKFYNRALSATEISQTWNKTLPIVQGPNNAGTTSLVSPVNFCAGSQQVKVKITNNGSNRIDSVRVNWQLDGIIQPTVYWSSPIDTPGSLSYPNDTVVTLGSATFTSGIAKTLKAWTSMPNGVADTVNTDDTLNVVMKSSLNGNYTIGGVSPDYPTIAAAVADLNSYGVCGPVVFNIRTGTYTAQLSLSNIAGSSASNTIRFQSQANHIDSVNWNFTATATTDNYLAKLSGTKYISFKNLKFTSNAVSFSRIFDISGGCQFDTIQNCSLISATATASSVNTAVIHTDGGTNNSLVVLNNVISGGSWGLRLYGGSTTAKVVGAIIQGNQFINQYMYGIYSYYHQNSKIRNNTFTSNTTSSYYGIYSYYADSATEITGNRISGITLGYGLYMYYNYGSVAQPEIIANNSIQIGGTGIAHGIHSYYAQNNKIYNNSVNISSTSATTGYGGYFYYSAVTYLNNEIKNNVFANTGGGYAIYCYNPTLAGANNVMDYNNLYSSGSVLAQIGTPASTPANMVAWRAASLQDINSLSYRPGYTSATNLQPNPADTACWSLNGRGVHLAAITTDINGMPRPTTRAAGVPDIGAYEFTPTALPPVATMVSGPTVPGYAIQIFLFGGDTLARLVFDSIYSVPSFVHLRRRTGTIPPNMGATPVNYMYFYDSIYAPSGTYYYSMEMRYKDAWLGVISNEGNMAIIKNLNPPATPWFLTSSNPSVDSSNNLLTASYLSDFGLFAGTDVSAPLPVTLLSLNASSTSKSIHISWISASEKNAWSYHVERSIDGKTFETIAKVKAVGNSNTYQKYAYDDVTGKLLLAKGLVYYRLSMKDIDGGTEYSKLVTVQEKQKSGLEVAVYPNPFNDQLILKVDQAEGAEIKLEIMDLTGKQVYTGSFTGNEHIISNLDALPAGVYFAKLSSELDIRVIKLIKK